MRVLHVIDSAGLYGAEQVVLSLMGGLEAQGVSCRLASVGSRGASEKPIETEARRRGLELVVFRFAAGPNIVGAWRLLRCARRWDADVIHSHGYKGNILLGLLVPRRLRGIPLVTTLHGWTHTGGGGRMGLYERLDALAMSRLDRVVLVSEAMRGHERLAGRDNLITIPNGIEPRADDDAPLEPEFDAFYREGFRIGCVGRLSSEKGHDVLIRAAGRLVRDGVPVRLAIVGEGPLRASLEEQIRQLGLDAHVRLAGYSRAVARHLARWDLFVLPSLTEGLPVALLEAMRAGVPVVCTRVGGMPEVIEPADAGILVPARDEAALADAMLAVRNDPDRAGQMADRAAARAARDYSPLVTARRYAELYRALGAG